ncbi:MAG: acyltransferase family protein [Nocardioides sp.]
MSGDHPTDVRARDFRADIQGLRAVAVGLVALDHANVGPFDGGFVGVDVFFVISGYLITSLLLREVDRTGTLSLRDFYARRARRILPAALLVIIATIVLSVLFLDGAAALLVGSQAIWATFFAANIKFARDSTDYFAADEPASPLQHYWSLAVEEQFYVFWPLILLGAIFLLRKRLGSSRRVAIVVLVGAIVASLAWSLYRTETSPLNAYFSTTARAWELAVGALAAAGTPYLVRVGRPAVLAAASWLGVAMILVAALAFSPSTPFPGYYAILPVVGAALLLVGGLGTPVGWAPQGALSVAPMRLVGDWSYSLYLWHWPLIIVAGYRWGPVSGLRGVAILAVATALSALTYRFVEEPFRRSGVLTKKKRGRTRSLLLYPAMVVVVLPSVAVANYVVESGADGGGPAISLSNYGQDAGAPRPAFSEDPYVALVEASVLAAQNDMEVPADLQPSPLELKQSIPDLGDCEYFGVDKADLGLCPRGDTDAERTMVLIGDSHARQWIPALELIAEEQGYVAYFLVREGCPAADQTPWKNDDSGPNVQCADFQDWAAETVQELRPAITLMGTDANDNGYADAAGDHVTDEADIEEFLESGLVAQIERIKPYSDRTVILGDPPIHAVSPVKCLTVRDPSLRACLSPPEERSLTIIDATRRAAATAGAEFLETEQWFCVDDLCPTVVGRLVTHRDVEHLSIPYSTYLAPEIARTLDLE